jgi:sugar transferase (PEP-CTERM/EpsH1 system associated)
LDKGDRLTVFHLLKYFSERHRVSFICFLEQGEDPGWVEKVKPFCVRVEVVPLRTWRAYLNCLLGVVGRKSLQAQYYFDPVMARTVNRVIHEMEPDLLYAHTIRMGRYIEPYRICARVLAMQVSMTLNYSRLAEHASGFFSKMLYSMEYRKLRASEADFARRFDRVLLISRYDLNAIEQKTPLDNVFFSPHGIDFAYFSPDTTVPKEPHALIFTGNMNYAPNVDAALYFYEEMFPSIRTQVPKVKWYIVGADPVPEIKSLGRDRAVQVTGRVPDLRGYMNRAQVAIAPLRIGAGLQNKVLEGMSVGLPMVITSIANEGIQAVDGENVLVADAVSDFSDRVVSLLNNPGQRIQLGGAAREFIVRNWSWEKHFSDLEQMFNRLVDENRQSSERNSLRQTK